MPAPTSTPTPPTAPVRDCAEVGLCRKLRKPLLWAAAAFLIVGYSIFFALRPAVRPDNLIGKNWAQIQPRIAEKASITQIRCATPDGLLNDEYQIYEKLWIDYYFIDVTVKNGIVTSATKVFP